MESFSSGWLELHSRWCEMHTVSDWCCEYSYDVTWSKRGVLTSSHFASEAFIGYPRIFSVLTYKSFSSYLNERKHLPFFLVNISCSAKFRKGLSAVWDLIFLSVCGECSLSVYQLRVGTSWLLVQSLLDTNSDFISFFPILFFYLIEEPVTSRF